MLEHEISLRVRYGETDQMGVVYHGNYPQYLELARVEWLRGLGISYKSMEETGCYLPVISLRISYKKPAVYDDLIRVVARVKNIPTVRIAFEYEIRSETGDLLATAETELAFMDSNTRRPMRCPAYILEKFP